MPSEPYAAMLHKGADSTVSERWGQGTASHEPEFGDTKMALSGGDLPASIGTVESDKA